MADLGIAPQNDGTVIRLTVPQLTGETRKEMAKKVSKYAEESKVQIRNIRVTPMKLSRRTKQWMRTRRRMQRKKSRS